MSDEEILHRSSFILYHSTILYIGKTVMVNHLLTNR